MLLAFGLCGWSLWTAGASVLDWMKTGVWSHPTLGQVWVGIGGSLPSHDWVMIQRAIHWIANLPSAVIVGAASIWLFVGAQQMDEEVTALERRGRAKAGG